ncbi:hypothetical protein [Nostoc sp. NMS4]|nr:hypothetical protein [Nostoc sp. NMS4]
MPKLVIASLASMGEWLKAIAIANYLICNLFYTLNNKTPEL